MVNFRCSGCCVLAQTSVCIILRAPAVRCREWSFFSIEKLILAMLAPSPKEKSLHCDFVMLDAPPGNSSQVLCQTTAYLSNWHILFIYLVLFLFYGNTGKRQELQPFVKPFLSTNMSLHDGAFSDGTLQVDNCKGRCEEVLP